MNMYLTDSPRPIKVGCTNTAKAVKSEDLVITKSQVEFWIPMSEPRNIVTSGTRGGKPYCIGRLYARIASAPLQVIGQIQFCTMTSNQTNLGMILGIVGYPPLPY